MKKLATILCVLFSFISLGTVEAQSADTSISVSQVSNVDILSAKLGSFSVFTNEDFDQWVSDNKLVLEQGPRGTSVGKSMFSQAHSHDVIVFDTEEEYSYELIFTTMGGEEYKERIVLSSGQVLVVKRGQKGKDGSLTFVYQRLLH